ncbi:MAG: DUF2807 domain-containing protein [Bacteroidia bacterium]
MERIKTFSKILCAAILIMQNATAQENHNKEFTKINLPDHAHVILKQGDESSVRFESGKHGGTVSSGILNGVLTINSEFDVEAYITVKDLEKITISGNAKVETEDTIKTKNIELIILGIGKIDMNLEAENVETDISGRGTIELHGSGKNLVARIPGAGKVEADNFSVNTATIDISGAGKFNVDVKDELNINISGVGTVNYVNEPAKVTKNISGLGKIENISSDNTSSDDDENISIGSNSISSPDSNTVYIGNKKIVITSDDDDDGSRIEITHDDDDDKHAIHFHHSKKTQAHWGGFELGFNNFGQTPFSTTLPEGYDYLELNTGKSIAVNLNLFDYKEKIVGRKLMFVTGLGISWNNWKFSGDRTLIPDAPELSAKYDSIDYSKNKLTASYINLPLLLEFNTNEYEKKTFHVGTGIIMGYRIGSHTKQEYDLNGSSSTIKKFDDFNLEAFRYDATLRVGYRGYTVFFSYGLNSLFKKNQSPELHSITFGLTLLNW